MARRHRLLAALLGNAPARRITPMLRRLRSGMTLGVRIAVLDGDRVLLVRHGYTKGWHLPGGGVDVGETAEAAARRELMEETGCEALGTPMLAGLFFNPKIGGRDHVALFVCRSFRQGAKPAANAEIMESGFFARSELPEATTKSTRRRLAEIFDGAETSQRW